MVVTNSFHVLGSLVQSPVWSIFAERHCLNEPVHCGGTAPSSWPGFLSGHFSAIDVFNLSDMDA